MADPSSLLRLLLAEGEENRPLPAAGAFGEELLCCCCCWLFRKVADAEFEAEFRTPREGAGEPGRRRTAEGVAPPPPQVSRCPCAVAITAITSSSSAKTVASLAPNRGDEEETTPLPWC